MRINILLFLLILTLDSNSLYSQKGKELTLFATVEYIDGIGAKISWVNDENFGGTYHIYKNTSPINQILEYEDFVDATTTTWIDESYMENEIKEYAIFKVNSQNQFISYDFVTLGKQAEQPNQIGNILLLIDDTYEQALAQEIAQLQEDLTLEGWIVSTEFISRKMSPLEVKSKILESYSNSNGRLKTLYLLGHVPVPYSGYFSSNGPTPPPDGHVEGSGNHTGAWPADLYYGDIDGVWTDKDVNYTDSKQERNNNIPNDGKFDQTLLPSLVELEIGRVDFYDMPEFADSDTILLKKYMDRAHKWRTGQLQTVKRGLIDDNFKGLTISNTGYKTINYLLGVDSLFDNRDYMTELESGSYLFSFGMGAGSYTSCNGIGTTKDFAAKNINTIFTGLAGSYFGDWDSKNNILRAALASGALASFWGGIPNWYLQPMAVGNTIGFCTRYSQNASLYSFNNSQAKVHIALMGDPTLKLDPVVPAIGLVASKTSEGIELNWQLSDGEVDGYNIYRFDMKDSSSTKVNASLITDNTYIDRAAPTGTFEYQVRAVKNANWANNNYYALGQLSASGQIDFVSSVEDYATNNMIVAPNPSNGSFELQMPSDMEVNELIIYDLQGNIVYRNNNRIATKEEVSTKLQAGNYLLKVVTNESSFIKKIQIVK